MKPSNPNLDAHFDRRTMLRRGALIGGALWVAPAVQVLGAKSADAASQPGPTSTGTPTGTNPPPTDTASPSDSVSVSGTSTGGTTTSGAPPGGAPPAGVLPTKIGSLPGGDDTGVLGSKLAQTGAAVGTIAAVGAAAIVGGAAVKRAGRTPVAASGDLGDGTDDTTSDRSGRRH